MWKPLPPLLVFDAYDHHVPKNLNAEPPCALPNVVHKSSHSGTDVFSACKLEESMKGVDVLI